MVGCVERLETAYEETFKFCPDILLIDMSFRDTRIRDFISLMIRDIDYVFIPVIVTATLIESWQGSIGSLNVKYYLQKPYAMGHLMKIVAAIALNNIQ